MKTFTIIKRFVAIVFFTIIATMNGFSQISCPNDTVLIADPGTCGAYYTYASSVGYDPATGNTVYQVSGIPSGEIFPVSDVTYNIFEERDTADEVISTCSFAVTVLDNELPILNCPGDINLAASTGNCYAQVFYNITATDNCPDYLSVGVLYGLSSDSNFPIGVTPNAYVAIDAAGNIAQCAFNVTVNDNEAPVINCPNAIIKGNDPGKANAKVIYNVTTSDNCPGVYLEQTAGLPNGAYFPIGVTTNSFMATDASGNIKTASFTVQVNDVEMPTISPMPDITLNNGIDLCGAYVIYPGPSYSDNSNVVTLTQTTGLLSGSFFPIGNTYNSFKATDGAGNYSITTFIVTVIDNQAPVIICPSNIVVNNKPNECGAVVCFNTPVATDNCTGQLNIVQTIGLASCAMFPVGTTTNCYKITDLAGNTAICCFTVTVIDNQVPFITCPGNRLQGNAMGMCGDIIFYDVTGYDNCDGYTITQTSGNANGAFFPVGTTLNSFIITDASGNSAKCSFTVTIQDVEGPQITCPDDMTVNNAIGECGAVVNYTVTGNDNCPLCSVTKSSGYYSGEVFPIGTTLVEWTVRDAAGATNTCSFNVTVLDIDPPTLNLPENITIANESGEPSVEVTYSYFGTDNCPGYSIIQTEGLPSGSSFLPGITTNCFLITDASGNSSSGCFNVFVNSPSAPLQSATLQCMNIFVDNDAGQCSAVVSYAMQYSDTCQYTLTQTEGLSSGAIFPLGITVNTFRLTDVCGNDINCSFTVTVVDAELPVIICPPDIQAFYGTPTNFQVVASDNCPGSTFLQTGGLMSGAIFPNDTTVNTFVAMDAAGNISTCSFNVYVSPPIATIQCFDIIVANDSGQCSAVVNYTLTISDSCEYAQTQIEGLPSGSIFPVGITVNTFNLTDVCGNVITCSFTVKVVDTELPVIICPQNIQATYGAATTYQVTVTDNCPGYSILQTTGLASGAIFPVGNTVNTFVAQDAEGNIASWSFNVYVAPPLATMQCLDKIVANDTGVCSAVVNYTIQISDPCQYAQTQIEGLPSGSIFPIGITVNTFRLTDVCGNDVTCSFAVKVVDIELPVITCPPDIQAINGAPTTYQVVASDNCPGYTILQTAGLFSGAIFPVGSTVNTFVATDATGNIASCSFNIHVVRPTAIMQCLDMVVANDPGACSAVVDYTLQISDLCQYSQTQIEGLPSGSIFPIGITLNTFRLTDICGNDDTCSFIVKVVDTEVPVITCPPDIQATYGTQTTYQILASNNCPGYTVLQTSGLPSGTIFPSGTTVNTFVVKDLSGNIASCSFDVYIAPPVATLQCFDFQIANDSGECSAVLYYALQTSDSCQYSLTQIAGLPSGSAFPIGVTVNTYRLTDICGNDVTCSFTVEVIDIESPIITCPSNIQAIKGTPITYQVGASDNCPVYSIHQITGLPCGSLFPVATTINTFVATDAAGNIASCSFNVTIIPSVDLPPVITCPANITVNNDINLCSAVVTYNVTATDDNPGVIVTQTVGLPIGSVFPVGITTNIFKATDIAGNTSICTFKVTVKDAQAPIITCPSNILVAGKCNATVTFTVTASDNCPNYMITQTAGLPNGSSFSYGTTTNIFKVTDAAGNTAICSFTVQVLATDNTPPVITCPATITKNNDANFCSAVVTYNVTATDNNPGVIVAQTAGLPSGSVFSIGTTTNNYLATDIAGNTSTCTFKVVVKDVQAPTITCPTNITVAGHVTVNYTVVASDNCPNYAITQTSGLPSGSYFSTGTTTNTFKVTDAAGNMAICSFAIIVIATDNTPPVITCPANINKSNDANLCSAVVTYNVTASDNYPGVALSQTAGLISGSVFPVGTTNNTFKATDAVGNTSKCTFNVVVNDVQVPTVTCPANITTAGSVATTYSVTASDNCTGYTITRTAGLASGSVFPTGITTNTFKATDAAGNTATCSFNITVDALPPVITCPATITKNNDANLCSAVVTYNVTATDNYPGVVLSQTAGLPNGSVFPVGTTTNTFKAADAVGNTATCTFKVIVNDVQAPTVTCPANITTAGSVATTYSVIASDNCTGYTIIRTGGLASGSVFPTGITTNIFKVTDAAGNTATCSFNVTVDAQPPVITCPATITKNNDANLCSAVVTYNVTATDNYPGVSVAQISGLFSGSVFPVGTTTNTFKATDAVGNTSTCTFKVIVNDVQVPTITCPANITAITNGVATVYSVTVSDNCTGYTVTQTSGLVSGSIFPAGTTTTNTFKVTDVAGNIATCSFTVTMPAVDVTPPVITCPATITKNNDANLCSAMVTYTVTATDNKPGVVLAQIAGLPSGSIFPVGATTNSYKATDLAGNTATCNFKVIVNDVQVPTITCPANITVAGKCHATVTYIVTASDNCPGYVLTQTAGLSSGSSFSYGTTTNTFKVTDATGNTATCSFTVIVLATDNTPPVITCPATITKNNDANLCIAVVTYNVTATDNNPGVIVIQTSGLPTGSVFPVGTTTNTFRATDIGGNTATCTFKVVVTDVQKPVIACPANINAAIGVATTYNVTASDNCTGYILTQTAGLPSGSIFPTGTTANKFKVTDASGNTATCSFNVVVASSACSLGVSITGTNVTCQGIANGTTAGGTTIYTIMGVQSVTLYAIVTGGASPNTYKWSTGATTKNITVTPAATTNYSLTVTDMNGCSAVGLGYTVNVIDICCDYGGWGGNHSSCRLNGSGGNNDDGRNIDGGGQVKCGGGTSGGGSSCSKVLICHTSTCNPSNPQTVCVSLNLVSSYFNQHPGDCLGQCKSGHKAIDENEIVETNNSFISCSPNPFTGSTTFNFGSAINTNATINIFDLSGKLIKTLYKGTLAGDVAQAFTYQSNLAPGVYIYQMQTENENLTGKMIVQ